MDYSLSPTLEHITLVKIITELWNENNNLKMCLIPENKAYRNASMVEWFKIEDEIIKAAKQLPLPAPLKMKVLSYIKPIGLEILKWINYHMENKEFCLKEVVKEFHWTQQGTIDKKKTAKTLIENEKNFVSGGFKIASNYCLETEVKLLRPYFELEESYIGSYDDYGLKHLVLFWNCYAAGRMSYIHSTMNNYKCRSCTPFQYMLKLAASRGNKIAVEYFYQKLAIEEKDESLEGALEYAVEDRSSCLCFSGCPPTCRNFSKDYTGVICFILSKMTEEQQLKMFERYANEVLLSLLDWPWQGLFLDFAKHVSPFLHKWEYKVALKVLVQKILEGYNDCNYDKLFRGLWQQMSKTLKDYFMDDPESLCELVSMLFRVESKDTIFFILMDASVMQKEELIFYCAQNVDISFLVETKQWDFLEVFISSCIASQKKLLGLKHKMQVGILKTDLIGTPEETALLEFLDGLIQKANP